MTGCWACDIHGPDLPDTRAAVLTFHRELHAITRILTAPLHRLLERVRT